jgi:AbrB family looped-hinge helix DNA binding protein
MTQAATVSSKGQVTLPAALRAKLGLAAGSKILFFERKGEIVIRPEPPMESFYGMLKGAGISDTDIPKEPDRF